MLDQYKLQRFLDAQADTYNHALDELKAGRKVVCIPAIGRAGAQRYDSALCDHGY